MTTKPASRRSIDGDESSAGPTPLSVTYIWVSLVGAAILTVVVLYVAGHSGGTLDHPIGARVWELAVTGVALGILAYGVARSVQLGKLSRTLLIAVATATAFWQETYGDWGTYLLYSPKFTTYDWGHTSYSSPNQCWWFIPGYVFFYTTFLVALEKTYHSIKARRTSFNPLLATTAVAFPLFYVFDIALEGSAHGFGWWQYQYSFGPSMAVGTGHFPLLWPILEQVPFMALAVYGLTWRNAADEDVFEVAARTLLHRVPGQPAIVASWIVIMNVAFIAETILPLMLLRIVAGPTSAVVP